MKDRNPLAQQMVQAVARLVRHDGHTYVPLQELGKVLRGNLSDVDLVEALHDALDGGALIKMLLPDGTVAIYLPAMYQMEKSAARRLREIAETTVDPIAMEQGNRQLSDEQAQAVRDCLSSKISVLTGGPGTGKTTTLKAIIEMAEQSGLGILLGAPTGQAAKRLRFATGREATTIHRLLGYNPETKQFRWDKAQPLVGDLVVIDEASMLDLWLLHHLLCAVKDTTRLVFVGDVHQLPSVAAGNVLHDLIASGIGQVAQLTRIFRQDEGSCIVRNARAIREGIMPVLDNQSRDFFLFHVTADKTGAMIADLVAERIPQTFGLQPEEIQVLSPMYQGNAGVDAINRCLQEKLNPDLTWYVRHRNGLFKVGDRVIQTRNNYEHDVMNGEVGRVVFIDKQRQRVAIQFDPNQVTYTYSELRQVKLAYAITIHRSQGSEYHAVVMPVVKGMSMLQRHLLYTAITRAKQLVVLVGCEAAVQAAVQNSSAAQRWTTLATRIQM